ncbi:hypothetical protein SAMN05421736_1371 [Evansella caseinilytica]|uniref:Uncharacterized protein n=1 Tax=Evansella caseinilytica TaxID=1503961 RepID=A0A1H3V1N0_9BACI|nr:hypothetical protein SAMN05421736_1371 [Evansella caseinilytica]
MSSAYSSIVPSRNSDSQSTLLRFLVFSLLNYVLWWWLLYELIMQKYWEDHAISWILLLFTILVISPYVLGLIAGMSTKKEWTRKLLKKVGLNPIHGVPTAWDYVMDRPAWVIITLKDDSTVYGFYGKNSFASSIPNERDIYVEVTYDFEDNKWIPDERSVGIWIPQSEIKHIELFNLTNGGEEGG